MTENNAIRLREQLLNLGFEKSLNYFNDYVQAADPEFTIYQSAGIEKDQLMYVLRFANGTDSVIRLLEYELTLRQIPIPDITIDGIRSKELENRMDKAEQLYNQYLAGNEDPSENYIIESGNRDLQRLIDSGKEGKELAQLFMFKYWPENKYEGYLPDDGLLRHKYESTLMVQVNGENTLTALQAYNKLKEMPKEQVISDEVLDMIGAEINNGKNWLAYNSSVYFIDKKDVKLFKDRDAAGEFVSNTSTDDDYYKAIYVQSIADVFRQIPYGQEFTKQLSLMAKNLSLIKQGLMERDNYISLEVHHYLQATVRSSKENWLAYNENADRLQMKHVYFAASKKEATDYAFENNGGNAVYRVINYNSVEEAADKIITKNLSIMNEKNFDYLSNQLKYTGFGEDLQAKLEEKMKKQEPQFTLNLQKDYGKDQTVATLHFKKSDESEMYFFNRYSLMLKNDQHPDAIKQTFFISNKENNITLKEAYNLMSGRAVHKGLSTKEGEKYNAWQQIDFKETETNGNYKMKQFHENYKYDLPAILGKHPIKELSNDSDKQRLIESLERGNRQSVTLVIHGREQKVFIEAAPQFKSLNFYEASGQRIRTDQLYERNTQDQSMKLDEKKQNLKEKNNDNDEAPEPSQKKSKRKRQTIT
jgi:hypothetical protein